MALCLLAAACDSEAPPLYDPRKPEVIDAAVGLERKDYADILKPDPGSAARVAGEEGPPIPDLAPILASPPPPKIGQTKLVSITVTDDVPLKDVLIELARLADIDIEVDAGIAGGVSFRAKDRPFNEVIERLANLAGLRYKMAGGVLRIERDMPYVEIYPIDFINIERSTTSSVNISTNVLSSSVGSSSSSGSSGDSTGGSSGSTSKGLNTGSSSSITASSNSDFWKQFEEGIKQILTYRPATLSTAQSPAAAPAAGAASASSGAGQGAMGDSERTFYILNRQGATLTVSGTQRQHDLLKQFLRQMETTASAQVLIEAKIVEVTLNQTYQSGIDWSKLGGSKIGFRSTFGAVSDPANIAVLNLKQNNLLTGLPGPQGNFNAGLDLDLAVRLTEEFGTTRTLSSPRLHAINNQQAVLTFAENRVYFQITVERETTTSTVQNTTLTVNSEIKTVPIGIILMIQPSINLETNEVTLNVRPTLSRVTGSVSDPAVAFLVAEAESDLDIESTVPVVEVRELDSILKLKSGQVMVIGGLMENNARNRDTGIPYAQTIPVLGEFFKGVDRNDATKELIIFIRATIVDSSGHSHPADRTVYRKFTTDPRPLEF